MGCGQSKILIYHRKSKADKNNYERDDSDASDSHADPEPTGSTEGLPEHTEIEQEEVKNADCPSSLLDSSEISTSQIDFFKMLDEKIESGRDYEEDEQEREVERLRLQRLLQDWMRRPLLDTQRFPTAYQPCPPLRAPRVCPRLPIYPTARAYLFSRAVSVETAELQYHDPYAEGRREESYGYATGCPPPPEQYAVPNEPSYGYSRILAGPPPYGPSMDGPEVYTRSRALLSKTTARAMSFDLNPYHRGTMSESLDCYGTGPGNDFLQRGREMHYTQHIQHNPYPPHVQYGQHSQMQQYGPDGGQEHMQYMAKPPPREMPPLQGVPGPPGPPHGSPRPLAVRLPTSAAWRRPRGPVTELV